MGFERARICVLLYVWVLCSTADNPCKYQQHNAKELKTNATAQNNTSGRCAVDREFLYKSIQHLKIFPNPNPFFQRCFNRAN